MSSTLRPLPVAVLLLGLVLGGCTGPRNAGAPRDATTRPHVVRHDTDHYRVQIRQWDRNGVCDRRAVLFTSYSRLYITPHVNRVRAVDVGCDAVGISGFEQFEVMRSPTQQSRYLSDFWFRNRVDEDLWDAYQTALFRELRGRT